MQQLGSHSDDFYVNMNLSTEMDLPQNRETVLHFFEQIQKRYPSMRNFYSREKGDFILEEEKESGHYRWSTIEARRICSGYVNPGRLDDAFEQHRFVLELAPYMLSVSPLDCDALDVLYGFDFTYRGNHNELVAEALGFCPALESLPEIPGATMIHYEPSMTFAVDDDCRIQCRVSVETRTTPYHIRSRDYPEEQLSVYVTARRYGSLVQNTTFLEIFDQLTGVCQTLVEQHVVEHILQPLARTIAMK